MAQVIYEGHPLEDYLQELGEKPPVMPGEYSNSNNTPMVQHSPFGHIHTYFNPPHRNELAERFKYGVISSTLLAEEISSTPVTPPELLPFRSAEPRPKRWHQPHYWIGATFVFSLYWWEPLGWKLLAIALIVTMELHQRNMRHRRQRAASEIQSLTALTDLIEASANWDRIISESVELLDARPSPSAEIFGVLYDAISSTAMHSTSARRLLLPLTHPEEAAQLTGMYAPPSPRLRPWSLPAEESTMFIKSSPGHQRSSSSIRRKRSTWNGTPKSTVTRTPIQSIFDPTCVAIFPSNDDDDDDVHPDIVALKAEEYFGSSALRIRTDSSTSSRHRPTFSTSSRYTNMPPFSPRKLHSASRSVTSSPTKPRAATPALINKSIPTLATIQNALTNALAARRYACAHLLALRFQSCTSDSAKEREDYWADVNDILQILATAYKEAATRVESQLSLLEKASSDLDNSLDSLSPIDVLKYNQIPNLSFAPTETPSIKFVEHISTLTTAIDDFKEGLANTISILQSREPEKATQALSAYDSVRKDLSIALREFERGRLQLLNMIPVPEIPSPTSPTTVPTLIADLVDSSFGHSPASSWPSPVYISTQLPDTVEVREELEAQEAPPEPMDGVERVYSADPVEIGPFSRERSKLSRAERIAAAKAAREQVKAHDQDSTIEGAGHSDVMEELKQVIERVAERKRKSTAGNTSSP